MKILLDMNVPLRYAELLRAKGLDASGWTDFGLPNASDTEIMEFARNHNFIVMTCDLDFSAILSATHQLTPSVVQIRGSILGASEAVELIVAALSKYRTYLENGAILSINAKTARLRILPI